MHLRAISQPHDNLFLLFKSDKKNRKACDTELLNLAHLSQVYAGIPIYGLSDSGHAKLKTTLQNTNSTLPVGLKTTRLTISRGKHMAIIPCAAVQTF
jgi:hypothetical protein